MMEVTASDPVDDWRAKTDTLLLGISPRGKSLIMTIYGDAILPLGGGAWLGDLIGLLEPLGLNERVVRTSVYRLVQDGLLEARQVGRRSFYALTATGARQTATASRRIYALRPDRWDGVWTQVWLPTKAAGDDRDALIQELTRLGFGFLTEDVLIHDGGALDLAVRAIEGLNLTARTGVFSARIHGLGDDPAAMRAHVARIWPLDTLAAEYAEFLGLAKPILAALETNRRPDAATSFQLRSLLIHAYRRIVLKDPLPPVDLTPLGWPGIEATETMRELYSRIASDAQGHVTRALHTNDNGVKELDMLFSSRFCP